MRIPKHTPPTVSRTKAGARDASEVDHQEAEARDSAEVAAQQEDLGLSAAKMIASGEPSSDTRAPLRGPVGAQLLSRSSDLPSHTQLHASVAQACAALEAVSELAQPVDPAPDASEATELKRLPSIFRGLTRAIDAVELAVLRHLLRLPAQRARLLTEHGYEAGQVPLLYRCVSGEEARALKRNGWRYDASDPRDDLKFAMPSLDLAKKFAPPGGAVIEIRASQAIRWHELSQYWNRPTFTREVREHVVPTEHIEAVRLIQPTSIRPSADTVDTHRIDRTVRAGETVDVELEADRHDVPLEQVDLIWNASYSIPDPSRGRTPEGKPFFKDGVYASTYVVDSEGRERQLDDANFVDVEEEDNLHDLGAPWSRPRGEKLRIKFFAKEPEGEGHPVELRAVRVRYRAEGKPPQVRLPIGRILQPGESVSLPVPAEHAGRPLVRVEVRWTDMLSGTWERCGHATGTLLVDGRRVGAAETVQSPEVQSFAARGLQPREVGLVIEDDPARIDWIKLYFED